MKTYEETISVKDLRKGDVVESSQGTFTVEDVDIQSKKVVVTFDKVTPEGKEVTYFLGEIIFVKRESE